VYLGLDVRALPRRGPRGRGGKTEVDRRGEDLGRAAADPNTPLVRFGAHGAVVSALQHDLRTHGGAGGPTDPGSVDGQFGPKSEKAVRAYQGERGVGPDGIVGGRT
jgi:peptidoglycan hydrolase-like protein with peptidoglycan-binding domain